MSAYRWRGGPEDGQYIEVGYNDYVVKVAKPLDILIWKDHNPEEVVKIAYIECKLDHENHEVIWPDDNWRGYWADERPVRVFKSHTISNHDYIKKDQIIRDLETDMAYRMDYDDVLSWSGEWVMKGVPARWQYVGTQVLVYCDNEMHGVASIDARWWCSKYHPESLFERKQ